MVINYLVKWAEEQFADIEKSGDVKKNAVMTAARMFLKANDLEEYLDLVKLGNLIEEKVIELINNK
jgi:hypothetical protein